MSLHTQTMSGPCSGSKTNPKAAPEARKEAPDFCIIPSVSLADRASRHAPWKGEMFEESSAPSWSRYWRVNLELKINKLIIGIYEYNIKLDSQLNWNFHYPEHQCLFSMNQKVEQDYSNFFLYCQNPLIITILSVCEVNILALTFFFKSCHLNMQCNWTALNISEI